jgi:hypothetical protein
MQIDYVDSFQLCVNAESVFTDLANCNWLRIVRWTHQELPGGARLVQALMD